MSAAPGILRHPVSIACRPGLSRGGQKRLLGPAAGQMLQAKALRLLQRRVKILRSQEGQLRRARPGSGQSGGIGAPDPARQRTLIGLLIDHLRFRETRTRPAVIGEGLASAVGQTGSLAGLEPDIEDRPEVGAVEVQILDQYCPPLGDIGPVLRSGTGGKEKAGRKGRDLKHPHRNLLSPAIPEC